MDVASTGARLDSCGVCEVVDWVRLEVVNEEAAGVLGVGPEARLILF